MNLRRQGIISLELFELCTAAVIFLSDFVLDGTFAAGIYDGRYDKNNTHKKSLPDDLAWLYFLDKYSSSKSYLTGSEITNIANRNCILSQKNSVKVHQSEPKFSHKCLTQWNDVNNVTSLMSVCPSILFQIDNPDCCSQLTTAGKEEFISSKDNTDTFKISVNAETNLEGRKKPSSAEVWGFGILFVTLISLSSLVGVSVLPLMGKDFYKHLLTGMVGLAVGSLTGSAVFHLMPQAFGLNISDPSHDYLFISLMICGGIWMFFMVERMLKFIMDYKDRKDKKWKHEKMKSVSALSCTPENSTLSMLVDKAGTKDCQEDSRSSTSTAMCSPQPDTGIIYECQEQAIKASFGHQERPRASNGHEHNVHFEQGKDSVIATVAWMIIFGDGLHNFIDGLSIGAAFNESILTGISISVAVLCEELPHELGDFAVLLNAGLSMKQALIYNFLSACTCYFGLGFGILLGEVEASSYIFALAAGMFLYIALVDMVPEMNEIAQETSKISLAKGMTILLLQNIGLFLGITVLFVLARYQDNIQF